MSQDSDIQIKIELQNDINKAGEYDFDKIIYDLESQIDLLSSQADKLDYLVSVS